MYKQFIFILLLIGISLPGLASAAGKIYTREQCLKMALATIIKEPLRLRFNVEDSPDLARL